MFENIGIKRTEPNLYIVTFAISECASFPIRLTKNEIQYIIDHWVMGINRMETSDGATITWFFDSISEEESVVAISAGGLFFRYPIIAMKDFVEAFEIMSRV